jgi:transitional endoplasmic reticulum ATPase
VTFVWIQYVRLGDFREMWVGQSERNFSRILQLLQSFGRVIVFMDELDQGEGASRNVEAHETSRRIFGKLLEFMASPRNRGQILWIAASNRPAKIDPALLRPVRFDLILPFDLPDAAGCREILERHLAATSMTIALGAP